MLLPEHHPITAEITIAISAHGKNNNNNRNEQDGRQMILATTTTTTTTAMIAIAAAAAAMIAIVAAAGAEGMDIMHHRINRSLINGVKCQLRMIMNSQIMIVMTTSTTIKGKLPKTSIDKPNLP